jgi:hypothetical protein
MMYRDRTLVSRKHGRCLAIVVAAAVMVLGAQATARAAGKNGPGTTFSAQAHHAASSSSAASTGNGAPALDPSYASREAKAKALQTFKGGDVVVIGSGALVIVLLVVLILVII